MRRRDIFSTMAFCQGYSFDHCCCGCYSWSNSVYVHCMPASNGQLDHNFLCYFHFRETLDHLMRLCLRKYPCGLQYFWNREENAEYCLPIGWMSVICCSQLRLQVVFFPVPKEALRVLNKAEKQSDAPEYSNTILNHILQSRSPPHKVEKMKKTIWHASKWQWDIHAWCFYWKKLVRQLLSCSWIRHLSFILLWGRGGDYLLWTNLMLLQKD